MVNVLPQQYRIAVARFYTQRLVALCVVASLITAFIVAAALMPSYGLLYINHNGHAASDLSKTLAAQTQADKAAIAESNRLLALLRPVTAASSTPTNAIIAALKHRPKGITLETITYSGESPTSHTITITGKTLGRAPINTYHTALAADPLFTNVTLPLDALVGGEGGQFSIRISGNF